MLLQVTSNYSPGCSTDVPPCVRRAGAALASWEGGGRWRGVERAVQEQRKGEVGGREVFSLLYRFTSN